MSEPRYIQVTATVCLSLAAAFIAMGSQRSHHIKPDPNAKFEPPPMSAPGFAPFDPTHLPAPKPLPPEAALIDDWTMVANTTFTGVTRQDDVLYYTYDPSKPRGKRSCPT